MRSGLDFVLFLLGSRFPERGQELNARLLRALNSKHLGYFRGARGWGDLGVVQGADQGPYATLDFHTREGRGCM